MTPDSPFPPLPPPELTQDYVIGVLREAKTRGWDVFTDRGGFVVETSATTSMRLDLVGGACQISFKNTQGPTPITIMVETPLQLDEALGKRLGGSPPTRSVRLKPDQPASNVVRIASLIRSPVEAVYDPYLSDRGLANLLAIVGTGGPGLAPDVRLLTARKSSRPLTLVMATKLFTELNCPRGAVRIEQNPKAHRRFMRLTGGTTLILGMSLDDIDKDEAAHVEDHAADGPFFESAWAGAVPLQ